MRICPIPVSAQSRGKREMAKPVPTGELLAQLHFGGLSHSIHTHCWKKLQRLRRYIVLTSIPRHPPDLKHAFYYRWLTGNQALGKIWRGETSRRPWGWWKRRVASGQLDKTKLVRWLVLYFLSGKVFCFSCLQHFLHTYNLMENRLKKD